MSNFLHLRYSSLAKHVIFTHLHIMHVYLIILSVIALTVFFDQSSYHMNENRGPVQPILVLSNPSSTDITVQVNDNSSTAMG